MIRLHELKNTTRPYKKPKLLGRGLGCKKGKTSGRGNKGYGSRSGWKTIPAYEGGQMRLFRKLPCRGFTRGRFQKEYLQVNLDLIDKIYSDGDVVSFETLHQKGVAPKILPGGIKILGRGELTKKVTIKANAFSESAIKKLEANKISYQVLGKND